tara:strand:+ start:9602 stop:10192 length:591 start_codon:yes stop_codon:yes gene_type:complete
MNAAEAVRFVTLHFLESYKDNLDEDNYESAKVLIENTPKERVVKQVSKVLKPFSQASENGKLNKKKLIKDGWVDENCKLTDEEIADMGKQAEMAYSLCCAINEMEPDKLKIIENMASTIQGGIESQIDAMSDEEKNNLDPMQLITSALSGVDTTGDIGTVVSTLMSSMAPTAKNDTKNKQNLLDSFSKIDGNLKKE